MKEKKIAVYSGLNRIPRGQASNHYIDGCLALEGGAWRGVYTEGVLDVLMMNDINLRHTIGVSAGAMNGIGYVSGDIGLTATMNLSYRHDDQYVGLGAFKEDHGITGFTYLFNEMRKADVMNRERFFAKDHQFTAVATNCLTGKPEYFDRDGSVDIFKAVQASATVPYVSEMVELNGQPYLDGGLGTKIPLDWALEQGFEKIVIVRTRDKKYRKPARKPKAIVQVEYRDYPEIQRDLDEETPRYNLLLDRIDQLEKEGRIFVIAPSRPITIRRFEGDMEELGALYWQGYEDAAAQLDALRAYLAQ